MLRDYLQQRIPREGGPGGESDGRFLAVAWHLGWAGFALVALIGMLWLPASLLIIAALVAAAVPGVLSVVLLSRNDRLTREGLLWAWALCSLIAVGLTGGIAGPLAAWCALPMAAAVVLNQRRLISLGAAQSLAVALVAAFVSLSQCVRLPDEQESFWLSAFAILSLVCGLGVALLPALRQRVERAADSEGARSRLLSLVTEQPSLILGFEATGRVIAAYGEAPPGLDLNSLLQTGLAAAAHEPDRQAVAVALQTAFDTGRAEAGFMPHGAMDQFVHLSLRKGADGHVYGVMSDASLNHAREAALEAARAEAETSSLSKTRFLASMSHELRTPLNAVIGFSDIMRLKLFGPLPEKYGEYAQLIWESGQHVLDLINDVLDMAKIEARKYELALEDFDMREPVSAALRLMRAQAHDRGIDIKGLLPPQPLIITADRRAVKQIALNLLSNAIKFTPRDGRVTLDLHQDAQVAELVITDTGIGIAPGDLGRLGQPFEQAGSQDQKAMGTGLGLSIVRAMASLHKGELRIDSDLGEGTTVTVRLPVVQGFPVEEVSAPDRAAAEPLSVPASQVFADGTPLDFTHHEGPGDFVVRPPKS